MVETCRLALAVVACSVILASCVPDATPIETFPEEPATQEGSPDEGRVPHTPTPEPPGKGSDQRTGVEDKDVAVREVPTPEPVDTTCAHLVDAAAQIADGGALQLPDP